VELPYETVTLPRTRRLVLNAGLAASSLGRLARSWRPDVVWASAAEGGFLPRALPRSVFLVATQHHPDPPPLPHLSWARHPWRALAHARRLQEHLLMASLLRGAGLVTVPSAWSRAAVLSRGYARADQAVEVVPNGVAAEWLEAAEPTPDAGETDLLFVGRLDHQKGLDVLLRALARPELEGVSARVVGTGPDEAAQRALAVELDVRDRLHFEGSASHDRIRGLARRSRCMVAPSRHESFCLVALEAMAAGLPVVASAVGGVPEWATDGVSALLVPPEDPEALAGALARVLGQDGLAERLRAGGREVAQRHTWDRVTEAALTLVAARASVRE
jgi:glycosyltransferase involved in cell wall biosynthesis